MKYKELYEMIEYKKKTSSWKKLKAYCCYVNESKKNLDVNDEKLISDIDTLIFPKFKLYTERFPNLINFSDIVGDFTFDIDRISRVYGMSNRYISEMKDYISSVVLYAIRKHIETIDQRFLDYVFKTGYYRPYKSNGKKFTICPGDINLLGVKLFEGNEIFRVVMPLIDNDYNLILNYE